MLDSDNFLKNELRAWEILYILCEEDDEEEEEEDNIYLKLLSNKTCQAPFIKYPGMKCEKCLSGERSVL